ncbi:MAG TPA: IS1595 family transposase [Bacteroidales bacterium]|nr:IS1595 family transposase [Bacteroidales bacterium]HSA44101.1 IS1595 family transposase [Bacteroidales bacterium]
MSETESVRLDGLFRKIELPDFQRLLEDEDSAYALIAAEKWKEGFVCRHCGHTNYCLGKSPHSRRCTRCKREESATAHTIFHKCKINLREALQIAYMVCHSPAMSSYELSRRVEIRQMTCWKFKKKIMECLEEMGSEGEKA